MLNYPVPIILLWVKLSRIFNQHIIICCYLLSSKHISKKYSFVCVIGVAKKICATGIPSLSASALFLLDIIISYRDFIMQGRQSTLLLLLLHAKYNYAIIEAVFICLDLNPIVVEGQSANISSHTHCAHHVNPLS